MDDQNELMDILRGVAEGMYPAADGSIDVINPAGSPFCAVMAFTARHAVVANVPRAEVLAQLEGRYLGAAMGPQFLMWLGERTETKPGTIDVLLAAVGESGATHIELQSEPALAAHHRVRRAAQFRSDVQVHATADRSGLLIIGRGLARRWEAAIEVRPECRNRGLGRQLAAAAKRLVPPGDPVFMQASPGNAASLRAVLAGGFAPVGAEVVLMPPHISEA